jgi:hypothetical protein
MRLAFRHALRGTSGRANLAPSWFSGGELRTKLSDGDGTRVFFEYSGFAVSQPWGECREAAAPSKDERGRKRRAS